MKNAHQLAVRIDYESLQHIEIMSRATGWTYGDIIRNALNLAYDWNIPLTGRKGQKNNLPD
jgi:hypothetical protein